MDELVLEGETYFSTKRAAKETGYAKDYVGQLCREGRVNARLVGRSWYVLASAIREHRFGGAAQDAPKVDVKTAPHLPEVEKPVARDLPSLAWEPARYESVSDTPLPNINRLHNAPAAVIAPGKAYAPESEVVVPAAAASDMQRVWSEWFEKTPNDTTPIVADDLKVLAPAPTVEVEQASEETQDTKEGGHFAAPEDDSIVIPLRTVPVVSKLPVPVIDAFSDDWVAEERAEALAVLRSRERAEVLHEGGAGARNSAGGAVLRISAIIAVLFALIFVVLTVAGTGYIDKYLISFRQVSYLSGIYSVIK